ncbi:MAG TPA: MerR family transcriptional regulator [Noviherbaspirillum sp.]|uniref:MerR family transcriptional regulator n=1 Tax=Noviherbaspirillum sp. TaxID=1926288 RepID=UPI002D587CE9|nr:MerR family transcriptional regulator [Noviherbaspirillum sp.]HYD97231.1 MerR family transcriptional regulator [Noviherbaspirillum sp.]
MSNSPPNDLSIAAVERETGLSKDTLRVWERRYNFPSPGRDGSGERTYPPEQVEKLRLIKGLMDQGHRPGKLVGADTNILRGMAAQTPKRGRTIVEPAEERDDLLHFVALCREHRIDELRRELTQCLLRSGIYRFVTDVIAPLTTMIGAQWASGQLAVFEEHLYTETVQVIMRNAISSIPAPDTATGAGPLPRIVLTTIPHELHGLGLLMAEAIFVLEGARCISLGVHTPVTEIAQAARVHAADIVALSFSVSARPAHVLGALADLRAELPPSVEIWAGGRSAVLRRRTQSAVKNMDLHDIPAALAEWRRRVLP